MPRLYAELHTRVGDKAQPDGQRVSGGGGSAPSLVISEGTEAFQSQIVQVLTSWEERVREVDNLSDVSGPRRHGRAVQVACDILVNRVVALLALPPAAMRRTCDQAWADQIPETATGYVHADGEWIEWNDDLSGEDAGWEILSLHHQCRGRLGYTPQHEDLITPCWECDERKLRRPDGSAGLSDHVKCLHCKVEYTGERLALLITEEQEARTRKAARERRRTAPADKRAS
jgi:hypothetical protein